MNYIKRAIYGPDPREQKQKCNALIRKNQRELDKMLSGLNQSEQKTKNMVKGAARRNDTKSARFLAKEIYGCKKQRERLNKAKAQLNSVSLQVNEAFALQKLEQSMKSSTGLMKEVNTLLRMPELMGTMNQLGQELMKSGIIEEMVDDTLDTVGEDEDGIEEAADEEVDKILTEVTGGKLGSAGKAPEGGLQQPEEEEQVGEEATEDTEADEEMFNSMRERLKTLQT